MEESFENELKNIELLITSSIELMKETPIEEKFIHDSEKILLLVTTLFRKTNEILKTDLISYKALNECYSLLSLIFKKEIKKTRFFT